MKIFFLLLLFPPLVFSTTYECKVSRKLDSENFYTTERIEQGKFSVNIRHDKKSDIERCSFSPSQNKVTCDKYQVDRVEVDKWVGIKKFYFFKGQFDVQLFPDMSFIENNGRGGISYGKCEKL